MGISKRFFYKIIFFTLAFIGILLIAKPYFTPFSDYSLNAPNHPQAKLFQEHWVNDLVKMKNNELLPAEWSNIKTIKAIVKSDSVKSWVNELTTPIETIDSGTHHLEILFYSFQNKETNENVVMTQYSLYEIKSTRLIWEMARNIKLKN